MDMSHCYISNIQTEDKYTHKKPIISSKSNMFPNLLREDYLKSEKEE